MFVVLLMAAAEASSTQGSLLGAFFTLLLYGLLPLGLVLYLMGTPMRRRARRAAQATEPGQGSPPQAGPAVAASVTSAISATDGHSSGEATGVAIAPVRKEA